MAQTLIRRLPYAAHTHEALTSDFIGSVTRTVRDGLDPPPPSNRWSARLVHRAQAPGQRFRVRTSVRNCRFSGLFIGTYSAVPYAAPRRVAQRGRPVRCAFAVESSVEIVLHRAA